MIHFNFSSGLFCPKYGVHFWHTYKYCQTCLCSETTRPFSITKAKHNTEVQNLPFSIISMLLPTSADKIELMSIADSLRTVVPA